jgi:hypothetical protein
MVDDDLKIHLTFLSVPEAKEYFGRICFLRNERHFRSESWAGPSIGGPPLLHDWVDPDPETPCTIDAYGNGPPSH